MMAPTSRLLELQLVCASVLLHVSLVIANNGTNQPKMAPVDNGINQSMVQFRICI